MSACIRAWSGHELSNSRHGRHRPGLSEQLQEWMLPLKSGLWDMVGGAGDAVGGAGGRQCQPQLPDTLLGRLAAERPQALGQVCGVWPPAQTGHAAQRQVRQEVLPKCPSVCIKHLYGCRAPWIPVGHCKMCSLTTSELGLSRSGQLRAADHIFMRWKEQCFVNASVDCGLTIAGFYYVCLSRQTGDVDGVTPAPEQLPSPYDSASLRQGVLHFLLVFSSAVIVQRLSAGLPALASSAPVQLYVS